MTTKKPFNKGYQNPFDHSSNITDTQQSKELHKHDDVDLGRNSHHHTLGYNSSQAAPGDEFKKVESDLTSLTTDFNALEADHVALDAQVQADIFFNTVIKQTYARFTKAAVQSIANNTATKVTFPTTSVADPNGNITKDAGNDDFTLVNAGIYLIDINLLWAGNATGRRIINLRKSDTTLWAHVNKATGAATQFGDHLATIIQVAANDAFFVEVDQNSGGALDLTANCWLNIKRLS